jgi:hypothetical protein
MRYKVRYIKKIGVKQMQKNPQSINLLFLSSCEAQYLKDMYSSSNRVRVNISRRMRWAGRAARMGKRRSVYRVLVGNLKERDHLKDLGVDGRRIRWLGHVARTKKRRGIYRVLVRKPEGKRPLGGPRRR